VGVGLGIIFRHGGTTGGVDILARIAEKRFGWKLSCLRIVLRARQSEGTMPGR